MDYLFGATTLILIIIYFSQTFRLAYWRQKALNRMDKDEQDIAKESGDGFFAFLR